MHLQRGVHVLGDPSMRIAPMDAIRASSITGTFLRPAHPGRARPVDVRVVITELECEGVAHAAHGVDLLGRGAELGSGTRIFVATHDRRAWPKVTSIPLLCDGAIVAVVAR